MKPETTESTESIKTYVNPQYSPPSPAKKAFKKLIKGLTILVVLVGIVWLANRQGILSKLSSLTNHQFWQELVSPQSQPTISPPQIPTAQVTITDQGFVPQTILIKKSSSVTWTNKDNKPHQIASDPHPTHSLIPTLGKGKPIPPNLSFTFTFDKTGIFTYHDEQNPVKFKGVVIVK